MAENTFSSHALVELFGHARIAGLVTEQTIAGQGFIRVDVPETKRSPAFTKLFGPSAIYSMTPVTEEMAQRIAEGIYIPEPIAYIPRQLADPDDNDEE